MLARLAMGVAMRLRFFTPVNGWSGFLTELVIVVLGILIALAAQQAVDNLRWRGEVKEFRAAMDNELGYNLGAYRDRLKQSACIKRRLDQLDQWQRGLQSGARLPLTSRIGRPTTTTLRSSVWQSRTADVMSHVGLENRLAYASLYDAFAGYQDIGDRERQLWSELLDFEGAAQLDRKDLTRLRGLIERGRLNARLVDGNWRTTARDSAAIGIAAWEDPDIIPSETVCSPLTWREG